MRCHDCSAWLERKFLIAKLPATNAVIFERHLIIFAERMADPIFRTQDSPRIGMSDKVDARQVEGFALVPIGGAPDAANGWELRQLPGYVVLPTRQHDFQHQAVFVRNAEDVIHD